MKNDSWVSLQPESVRRSRNHLDEGQVLVVATIRQEFRVISADFVKLVASFPQP